MSRPASVLYESPSSHDRPRPVLVYDSASAVLHPDGSIQHGDGSIDHPDGTVEFDGYFFEIDWNELDPPEGHPDAEEVPHEVVMAEMCTLLGLPPGSL